MLAVFLAELNSLELWGADVGNEYLEAKPKEKVYIVGGPEFGSLEGHTLLVDKALYGLRCHERLADVLRSIGFTQCKAEADTWMRKNEGLYEYIAVCVDDLLIVARNRNEIVKELKGMGPLSYHLGCDYFRDKDGTLCYSPKKYISKMIGRFENMFGCKPREYTSPLEKGIIQK
jgi:Reverse transcriptase (RNA-dependent DNA polymerase)